MFLFQIYSVINGVVRVYVTVEGVNINKYLMDQSIAEYCDESWMSKVWTIDFE